MPRLVQNVRHAHNIMLIYSEVGQGEGMADFVAMAPKALLACQAQDEGASWDSPWKARVCKPFSMPRPWARPVAKKLGIR